jgi:hypothetical protein
MTQPGGNGQYFGSTIVVPSGRSMKCHGPVAGFCTLMSSAHVEICNGLMTIATPCHCMSGGSEYKETSGDPGNVPGPCNASTTKQGQTHGSPSHVTVGSSADKISSTRCAQNLGRARGAIHRYVMSILPTSVAKFSWEAARGAPLESRSCGFSNDQLADGRDLNGKRAPVSTGASTKEEHLESTAVELFASSRISRLYVLNPTFANGPNRPSTSGYAAFCGLVLGNALVFTSYHVW